MACSQVSWGEPGQMGSEPGCPGGSGSIFWCFRDVVFGSEWGRMGEWAIVDDEQLLHWVV